MESRELRIGNYVTEDVLGISRVSDICQHVVMVEVNNLDIDNSIKIKTFTLNYSSITPILLTEDWLLKFGFTKHKNRTTKEWEYFKALPFDLVYITIDLNDGNKIIVDGKEFPCTPYVAFGHYGEGYKIHNSTKVHQLQNLYFALTGEDLIIK